MKILVISGFLGAGKTTFIKELSKRVNKPFVVMENEYGEANIDSDLLEKENLNIWELTEGCVCCQRKSDFASSILTIANTLDPEYLIVEPTGVGKLSQVMQNIKQIEYERIQLLEPITIIDSHSFYKYKKEYGDIYLDQIKSSQTLLLSKTDLPTRHPYEIKDELETLNPQANIIYRPYQSLNDEWFYSLLNHNYENKEFISSDNSLMIQTIGIKQACLPSYNHIMYVFEKIIRGFYGKIIRAKGFFQVENFYFQFDVVDDNYAIIGASDVKNVEAIFIGEHLNESSLRRLFDPNYSPTNKKIPIQVHETKRKIRDFTSRVDC